MRRLSPIFTTLIRGASGLAFAVLAGAVLIQVFTRIFLPQSPVWTEELSRFALMFVVAFGVGLAIRSGDLVNVDLFLNVVPKKARRILETIAFTLTATLGVVIFVPALEFMAIGEIQTSPALDWRMDAIFLAMPVTAAMVAIFGIEKALGSTRGKDTDATDAEGS
jgi:TRAP-type C4-dicarboxylate transport system permease small subunit